ncbi:MAG TPA: hypothetical protein VN408_01975, partial [Actinoplanes sp.]|nr:hypothetical protein [Actinoplanes sp.]
MTGNQGTDIDGARLLESLLEALARWPDAGRRPRVSIERWNGFTAGEVKAHQDEGISAIQGADGWRSVTDQIRELGRLRYEPAVPPLIGLWEECPVHPVVVAAGHALFEIGTAEARDALRRGIHDHEHFGRFMALKVLFTDDGAAWDNAGPLFSGERLATTAGLTAAAEALALLAPWSHSSAGPRWHSEQLRDLISQDRRWLDLCVGLRDHEFLGSPARQVLKYADSAVTGPALDAARALRASRPTTPVGESLRPGDLVARYRDGDHRGVWRDLGAVAHLDDVWRAEAEQVA